MLCCVLLLPRRTLSSVVLNVYVGVVFDWQRLCALSCVVFEFFVKKKSVPWLKKF